MPTSLATHACPISNTRTPHQQLMHTPQHHTYATPLAWLISPTRTHHQHPTHATLYTYPHTPNIMTLCVCVCVCVCVYYCYIEAN